MAKQPRVVHGAEDATNKKNGKTIKTLEIGDTGNEIYSGIVYDEYNTKLQGSRGFETYDEMRKSDGTVKATLLSVTLPVIRARWFVKPSDDPNGEEVADFITKALFEWQSITWADFVRQALLSLSFGVMPFEKVYDIKNWNGKDYIIWKKFAPRLPKSIQAWETSDKQPGLQQRKTDGNLANIPLDKLLIFVHEREGDNWEGNSMLRAAYKHWHMKNTFYKIDAIAFERQGLGVPYAKVPSGYTDTDRNKAETILKNMRAHDQAFVIVPDGYEIGFLDMNAHAVRDPSNSIAHHNREIAKSVLAQFLELGATSSGGSYALSQDQTDIFLLSLEAVAQNFSDVINKYAIPQLVDMNFDNVQTYPELTCTGITRVDAKKIADTYDVLVKSGGIKVGENDEQHFREMMSLPERNEEPEEVIDETIETPTDEDATEDEAIDELGLSEHKAGLKKNIFPERAEVTRAILASIAKLGVGHQFAYLKRNIGMVSGLKNKQFFSMVKGELTNILAQLRKKNFEETNAYKSFRPMTFAEKKVDFSSIEKNLDRLEDQFDKETQELLQVEREKYMQTLTKAVNKGDREAIKDATFKAQAAYTAIIKKALKDAYEYGKTNGSKELGLTTPANVKAILDQIDIQSDAIADLHVAQLTNQSKTALVEAMNKGASNSAALAAVDAVVAAKIKEITTNTSRIAMAAYVNTGRATVYENNKEKIYALQRSELLDSATCDYCLSVDGRVVEKDDPFAQNSIFHSGCRGIWVAIMLDEEELPGIGGIPASIKDRFGDTVNDLIQPRTPITKKDSLARKEVERRAKRKAGK